MDQGSGPSRASILAISSYHMSLERAAYTAEMTGATALEVGGPMPPYEYRFYYENVPNTPATIDELQRRSLELWERRGTLGGEYIVRLGKRIQRIQYPKESELLNHE